MDNETWNSRAREGLQALKLDVPVAALPPLKWLADELVRWNGRVNLTAITEPAGVLEKHILDSLAIANALSGVHSLLDLGAGAGFPGLPVALAVPTLSVQLVDAVAKKVGFMKHAVAHLELAPRVRALHATALGRPEREGISQAEAVVSRAFKDVEPWLELARPYVLAGGRVLAMVSHWEERTAEKAAAATGLTLAGAQAFVLPFTQAPRAVLRFDAP